jgi:hypothetical protein
MEVIKIGSHNFIPKVNQLILELIITYNSIINNINNNNNKYNNFLKYNLLASSLEQGRREIYLVIVNMSSNQGSKIE